MKDSTDKLLSDNAATRKTYRFKPKTKSKQKTKPAKNLLLKKAGLLSK